MARSKRRYLAEGRPRCVKDTIRDLEYAYKTKINERKPSTYLQYESLYWQAVEHILKSNGSSYFVIT
jgi:hypothetical protein